MKKFIILIFGLVCIANIYAVNSELSKVQTSLSKHNQISGNFKQIRNMALLSSPLISTGNFVLSKKHGLKWYQTTPFKSTLIVTPTKIEQKIGDNPATIITKDQQPIVFSFTNIFLSVFKGNTKAMQDYFKIDFTGNIKAWKITLTPIASPLNKAIVSIEMSGGKYINSITINEAQNNQMIIKLFNIK